MFLLKKKKKKNYQSQNCGKNKIFLENFGKHSNLEASIFQSNQTHPNKFDRLTCCAFGSTLRS